MGDKYLLIAGESSPLLEDLIFQGGSICDAYDGKFNGLSYILFTKFPPFWRMGIMKLKELRH